LKYEVLTGLGRVAAADTAASRAVHLDGLSALALNNMALAFMAAGKMDSAIHYSERAVSVAPTEFLWKRTLGTLYALGGRLDDGVQQCADVVGTSNTCRFTLGLMAGAAGTREQGLAALGAMHRLPPRLGSPAWAAMVYARLGMADSMFSRRFRAISR